MVSVLRAWFWGVFLGAGFLSGPLTGQEEVGPVEGYAPVAARLSEAIAWELEDKPIPGMSIALVAGEQVVWARGFGLADASTGRRATAATVYRAGSVSKLLTDLAVMQLVERGSLDLDAPVANYTDDVRPHSPFPEPITLRHLMAHRAGLVRESPVGNYFDASEPTLQATVRSLNETELVYAPGERTKYSNAGIAWVGYVLERTTDQPFADYLRTQVLLPLGMSEASFVPLPSYATSLAQGGMWSYDGRTFAAPPFLLGTSAAGNLYASVLDLGQFAVRLLTASDAADSVPVRRATLEAMWQPQFAKAGDKTGFGLGFHISQLDGHRRVGHGGAVYGHATRFAILPDDGLGVVVAANLDVANGVVDRLGDYALRLMLAARAGMELPTYTRTGPLTPDVIARVVGRYTHGEHELEITSLGTRAWIRYADRQLELKRADELLIPDDVLGRGPSLTLLPNGNLQFGDQPYARVPDAQQKPEPPPQRWLGLIGEYGWDHNTLFILESRGRLYALIEWCFFYPLTEIDENTFAFPADDGLYHGEGLVFERDDQGVAQRVIAAEVDFPRRDADLRAATFRIEPVAPIDQLRDQAAHAEPPVESGERLAPELTELRTLDATLQLDIRYAGSNNFLGTPVYQQARAFLQKPAAEAVVRVHRRLAEQGLGILVYDGYRPWSVTKVFYDATPDSMKLFVADPAKGSRHNRGCAVDLGLFDRATGRPIPVCSGYDEFSPRAFPRYCGGTSLERWHRDLLRRAMEAEGFAVYEFEWWHFDYRDWQKYPILNLSFEQLPAQD